MKQAVKITIETNEIQEALQQEIRGIVKHELRETIRQIVMELLPDEARAKLKKENVEKELNSQIREVLRDFYRNSSVQRIVKEQIQEDIHNIASHQTAEPIFGMLKDQVEGKMVDAAWGRIVKQADLMVERKVKELVENHVQARMNDLFKK
jgi:hypothetical protein